MSRVSCWRAAKRDAARCRCGARSAPTIANSCGCCSPRAPFSCVFGGAIGWMLAQWTGDALLALSPVQLPSFAAPATDWRTVLFVSIVGVVTTVGDRADAARDAGRRVAGAVAARRRGRVARRRTRLAASLHRRRRGRAGGRVARGRGAARPQFLGAARFRSRVRAEGVLSHARAVSARRRTGARGARQLRRRPRRRACPRRRRHQAPGCDGACSSVCARCPACAVPV